MAAVSLEDQQMGNGVKAIDFMHYYIDRDKLR